MPVSFPASLDNFTNPTPNDRLSTPTVLHTDLHSDANDAIEALQAKVGINGSLVTGSLDYRVNFLSSGTHSPVTLGTANGLSLSGQALSLSLSATGTSGALSAVDYSRIAFKNVVNVFTANQVVDAHAAVGADAAIDYNLNPLFWTDASTSLSVNEEFTQSYVTGTHFLNGMTSSVLANPSSIANRTFYAGVYFQVQSESGNANALRSMYGLVGEVYHNSDGNVNSLEGGSYTVGNYGAGDINFEYGSYTYVDHYGGGTIGEMYGSHYELFVGATATTITGVDILIFNDGGSATTAHGIKIADVDVGATNYAIHTGAGDVSFGDDLFLRVIKSGATQVAAGAAANEVWKTNGHATLPNNVLMIGV